MTERKSPKHAIEVCAYSRCSAAEVVTLVLWAEHQLATTGARPDLLEIARDLLWYEEHYDDETAFERKAARHAPWPSRW